MSEAQLAFAAADLSAQIDRLALDWEDGMVSLTPLMAAKQGALPRLVFSNEYELSTYLRSGIERPPLALASLGDGHAMALTLRTQPGSEGAACRTSLVFHDAGQNHQKARLMSLLAGLVDSVLFLDAHVQRNSVDCRVFTAHSLQLHEREPEAVLALHDRLLAGEHPPLCKQLGKGFFAASGAPASAYLSEKNFRYTEAGAERRQDLVDFQQRQAANWLDRPIKKKGIDAKKFLLAGSPPEALRDKAIRYHTLALQHLQGLQAQGEAGARAWFEQLARLQPARSASGQVQPCGWVWQEQADALGAVEKFRGGSNPAHESNCMARAAGIVASGSSASAAWALRLLAAPPAWHLLTAADRDVVVQQLLDVRSLRRSVPAHVFANHCLALQQWTGIPASRLFETIHQHCPEASFDFVLRPNPPDPAWEQPVVDFLVRHFDAMSVVHKDLALRYLDALTPRADCPLRASLLEKLASDTRLDTPSRAQALLQLQFAASELDEDDPLHERIEDCIERQRQADAAHLSELAPANSARLQAVADLINRQLARHGLPGCNAAALHRHARQHGAGDSPAATLECLALATGGKAAQHPDLAALNTALDSDTRHTLAFVSLPQSPYFIEWSRPDAKSAWASARPLPQGGAGHSAPETQPPLWSGNAVQVLLYSPHKPLRLDESLEDA